MKSAISKIPMEDSLSSRGLLKGLSRGSKTESIIIQGVVSVCSKQSTEVIYDGKGWQGSVQLT